MTKYFKNVKSFDDLKKQYKELLKKHHPDNGGDVEEMKNINVEFDSLFPIWKNRKETEVHETVKIRRTVLEVSSIQNLAGRGAITDGTEH